MQIKKGQVLEVKDERKGHYIGIATADFDTEVDEWYSISLYQDEIIHGISIGKFWERGEDIPARKGHVTLVVKE